MYSLRHSQQWEDCGPLVLCTVPNSINVSVAAVTCYHVKISLVLCINFAKCLFLLAWTVTICIASCSGTFLSPVVQCLPNLHVIALSVQCRLLLRIKLDFKTWTLGSSRPNSVLCYVGSDQGERLVLSYKYHYSFICIRIIVGRIDLPALDVFCFLKWKAVSSL